MWKHKGRLIAIGFGVFALVCGIVSLDFARGRVPETNSPMIVEVLSSGADKQCRRDVSAAVMKHIKPGMSRNEALRVIALAEITPPRPWFWRPKLVVEQTDRPGYLGAIRTLRTTAFGNELLLIDLKLEADQVSHVSARVECAFR